VTSAYSAAASHVKISTHTPAWGVTVYGGCQNRRR